MYENHLFVFFSFQPSQKSILLMLWLGCELRTCEFFFSGDLTGQPGKMVSNEGNTWLNTKGVSVETRNTPVCT